MTFNDSIRTNPGRASSSGGRGAMMAGGVGGLGGVVLLLLYMFMGGNPGDLGPMLGAQPGQSQQEGVDLSKCTTGEAANTYAECRMVATAESLDEVWGSILPQEAGIKDQQANLHLFTQAVNTGCGAATAAVGPFFCPADDTVYIDISFFDLMERQLGARNAPLSQEYIIAHEWGHHVQHVTGQTRQVDHNDTGPASQMVRMETQADCYAGVWVHHAAQSIDPESGQPFLKPPTREQISDVISATQAIGDDHIQAQQGGVQPEAWTHGSSEQRTNWFMRGFEGGTMKSCDTWSVPHP